MKKTNVIWSETWLNADIINVNDILQKTVNDFVKESDIIINIEVKVGSNGLSRFWIYIIKT